MAELKEIILTGGKFSVTEAGLVTLVGATFNLDSTSKAAFKTALAIGIADVSGLTEALDEAGAAAASQAEMEAGTETGLRSMSPLRIRQAIDALAPSPDLSEYVPRYSEVGVEVSSDESLVLNGNITVILASSGSQPVIVTPGGVAFSGLVTAPTAPAGNNSTRVATTAFVASAIATGIASVVKLQGAIDCSTNPNYPAASSGHAYRVSVAGKIGGAAGVNVGVGDTLVCYTTTAGGDHATVGANWNIEEANIPGLTTVGTSLITLSNPGAVSFVRINANNTVTARSAANMLSDLNGAPLSGASFTGSVIVTTTSSQARWAYDANNFLLLTITANGRTTLDLTQTGGDWLSFNVNGATRLRLAANSSVFPGRYAGVFVPGDGANFEPHRVRFGVGPNNEGGNGLTDGGGAFALGFATGGLERMRLTNGSLSSAVPIYIPSLPSGANDSRVASTEFVQQRAAKLVTVPSAYQRSLLSSVSVKVGDIVYQAHDTPMTPQMVTIDFSELGYSAVPARYEVGATPGEGPFVITAATSGAAGNDIVLNVYSTGITDEGPYAWVDGNTVEVTFQCDSAGNVIPISWVDLASLINTYCSGLMSAYGNGAFGGYGTVSEPFSASLSGGRDMINNLVVVFPRGGSSSYHAFYFGYSPSGYDSSSPVNPNGDNPASDLASALDVAGIGWSSGFAGRQMYAYSGEEGDMPDAFCAEGTPWPPVSMRSYIPPTGAPKWFLVVSPTPHFALLADPS